MADGTTQDTTRSTTRGTTRGAGHDVAARDPRVPALAELLDPAALADRLTTATGTPGTVRQPYLRYKPGTSCVLALRWAPDGGGRERDLLVRAYADHAAGKLTKGLRDDRPDELVALDRDAGLVVTGWTADRQLPGARAVGDLPAEPSAVLTAGRPGGAVLDGYGAPRLLRHNPERRAVLRVGVGGAAAGDDAPVVSDGAPAVPDGARAVSQGAALVRVARPSDVARTLAGYALLAAAADTAAAHERDLRAVPVRAPRVRAADAALGVVVTDWVDGTPLDRLDGDGADPSLLRDVGATVAALHATGPALRAVAPTPAAPGAAPTGPARATARAAADGLARLLPGLAGPLGDLATALDGARPPARTPVPVHGDLSLDQVVLSPAGELWLVDGDAARWGTPADDLGSLAAALVRGHGADAAAGRLAGVLAGYAAHRRAAVDAADLRTATAEHLLRRAAEPFRRLETGWDVAATRLVTLAVELVAGRGGALGAALDGGTVRHPRQPGPRRRPVAASPVAASPVPATARPGAIRTAPVAVALADRLHATGGRLRAVVPRSADRLLVVGTDSRGDVVAGRWDADPRAAARHARRVGSADGPDGQGQGGVDGPACADDVAGGGLVLHRSGRDPDLPGLGDRVAAGATLVAHRCGRRGVVREPDGTYTKVTRLGREPADVAVPPAAFATPAVVRRGPGWVTTAPLPGRTLHDLLGDPAIDDAALAAAARSVGRGLRTFQEVPHTPEPGTAGPGATETASTRAGATGTTSTRAGANGTTSTGTASTRARATGRASTGPGATGTTSTRAGANGTTPTGSTVTGHDAAAETAVVARWWRLAAAHGATDPATADAVVAHVARALDGAARSGTPAVRAHRDLHDKQVLVDLAPATTVRGTWSRGAGDRRAGERGAARDAGPTPGVGMIDLDLATTAPPELDLANLLVHLELRARQGHCTEARADAVARAVLDGYGACDPHALQAWATAARARLAAGYAFRPAPSGAPDRVPRGLLADLDRPPSGTAPTSTASLSTASTGTAPTGTAPTSTAPTSTAPTSTARTSHLEDR